MSEGTVRQWCRMFKDGRTNVHDEDRSGRPCVVSEDLVRSVGQKNLWKTALHSFRTSM
jgi:transposase